MDFPTSVGLVMNYTRALIIFPAWLLKIFPLKIFREVQKAKDEFNNYMHELISSATSSPNASARGDLLTSMAKASTQDTKGALSGQEIIGNIFIFVLAGHETTATALQTALIMLAATPALQQQVQDEIRSIWDLKKEGEDMDYGDYPKMRVIMALMVRVPCFSMQITTDVPSV